MAEMTDKQAGSPDLVYGLEDKPPFGNALLSAVTHLLAIFVPMITPALIVGGALELPVEMTAYLVSMAMVASGVGTYLQVNRFGPVGSGMLSIQSVNFSFVTVMIALGTGMKEGGLTEDVMISTLLGVSFVGAFLVCFSAWLLPYLKKVITPTVSGVVVMLIGLSLVHVGITDFGGGIAGVADCFGFQLLEKSFAAHERHRGGFDRRLYRCAVFGQSGFFRPAKPAADYPAGSV